MKCKLILLITSIDLTVIVILRLIIIVNVIFVMFTIADINLYTAL